MAKLREQVHHAIGLRGLSPRTEAAYWRWIAGFVRFHGMVHPSELGVDHVEHYLIELAETHAASSINQAHSALVFLYEDVLKLELEELHELPWAKGSKRLPAVLSREEVRLLLQRVQRKYRVMAVLMYGTGMRISEALSVRVKEVDFGLGHVVVRSGKGKKDRVVMLPEVLRDPLQEHLTGVRQMHERDLAADGGWVELPDGFGRKSPTAGRSWPWQWVFPSARRARLPDGKLGRQPVDRSTLQREVKRAARRAGIPKRVHPHVLRHSFATHLLEDGVNIRRVQDLMGHEDVRVTMRYLHLTANGAAGVKSPLDRWLTGLDDLNDD